MNPAQDRTINKFALDDETANIGHLLSVYDEEWNKYVEVVNKLESQIKNIEEEQKILRNQLMFKAKTEWGECGFDKSPTDKVSEAYPFTCKEYIDKHNILKLKREEWASAKTKAELYQNYHYQLITKERDVERLWQMWQAQYFIDSKNGGQNKQGQEGINELTNKLNRKKKDGN